MEWTASQRSFITGASSLNEKDLHENLVYFKVPEAVSESIRSKLAFKIFDEYANILKGMYRTRFDGRPRDNDTHDRTDSAPGGPIPPLITSLQTWHPNTLDVQSRRRRRGLDSINIY